LFLVVNLADPVVENYLYGTMQNLFGIWWNKQAAREYAAKHPEEKNADNERTWS
jgi:hypothetical protein